MARSLRVLNQEDPLTRQPEMGIGGGGISPMDPPAAFAPPALESVALADLHPFLRRLCEEHVALEARLRVVQDAVVSVQQTGFTKHVRATLLELCEYVNGEFVGHSRQEEELLFPLLHERLVASGEHSRGRIPTTSVDLMKDDHLQVIRLAAVVFNFLNIASHLPDERSTLVVRDAAGRHAVSLVDLLRVHMFREDNIVLPSAHRLISTVEFDRLQKAARSR